MATQVDLSLFYADLYSHFWLCNDVQITFSMPRQDLTYALYTCIHAIHTVHAMKRIRHHRFRFLINGGKQTIPKPIPGIEIDFGGSRVPVQFNQRLAGARNHFRSGCCRARSTGNLHTFLPTCTITRALFASDQRSGLNRLFVTGASNRLFGIRGSSPSPEIPLAPMGFD